MEHLGFTAFSNHDLNFQRGTQDKNQREIKLEITGNSKVLAFSIFLQFSKLTNSFEKLRLHQMKQNKFRRKELPHPKEETPFELSNLNLKLEVSCVFLLSSCLLKIDCGRRGLFVSGVHNGTYSCGNKHCYKSTSH